MKRIEVKRVDTEREGTVFRWTDRKGNHQRQYTGKCTNNRIEEARKELETGLNRTGTGQPWSAFVRRAEREYFDGLAIRSIEKTEQTLRKFAKLHGDFDCAELSTADMLDFQSSLRDAGLASATIDSTMQTLWAVVRWGVDFELLPEINRPRKRNRKRDRVTQKAKGRSLTGEEIDRMVAAVPLVIRKGEDAEAFVRAIHAARLMGLRLDDCHRLRFEPAPDAHWVTLDARQPFITFCDVQKSGETEDVPLTDAAVAWLKSLPAIEWIARGRGERGWHKTTNRTGRVVSAAGKQARILTKATGGKGGGPKWASLHDCRRTFATQLLATGMSVKQVQKRTRHADHNTLLAYYADAGHVENLQTGGNLVATH